MEMLPPTVCGSYIVCRGWWDPAIKSHLLAGGYEHVVVADRRLGARRIRIQAAVRGTGVVVRSANSPRPIAAGPIVNSSHEADVAVGGFGAARAVGAITPAGQGADVIIVEELAS
jgi:hypothetical protein